MTKNSFVALDFETANHKRTSICSVGMVKVVANEIVETFYTLVNPNDFFASRNIEVHGIHAHDVKQSPDFAYVYPYMLQFIGDLPVVAHNAAFDMSVLHASIQAEKLNTPPMTYFCSYQLAKRTVSAHRHGLKHMMSHFKLDFHGHHDALNDAKACAMITYRLLKHYPSLDNVIQIYGKQLTDKDML
ncbi:3'-5' exonuclease [Staphylococcus cornubiensis]|uniref:3'-5' exonuclease n=1 Tax=Staphylococcus cornubiensis TaxID=1986155 RepID=UPI000A392A1F|nr:3'-5' exonuclease [Staphylococcus cornubiensis]